MATTQLHSQCYSVVRFVRYAQLFDWHAHKQALFLTQGIYTAEVRHGRSGESGEVITTLNMASGLGNRTSEALSHAHGIYTKCGMLGKMGICAFAFRTHRARIMLDLQEGSVHAELLPPHNGEGQLDRSGGARSSV